MKKTLLVLAIMACFISCKKGDNTKPPTNTATKKKYPIQSVQVDELGTYTTTYTYDSHKRVIEIFSRPDLTVDTKFSWDDKNRLTQTVTLTSYDDGDEKSVSNVTYQDDKSTATENLKTYKGTTLVSEVNKTYTYENNKIKETRSDRGSTVTYTYDSKGNCITIQSNSSTTTLTYSDKKYLSNLYGLKFPLLNDYSSDYPVLTSKRVDAIGHYETSINYTYTFDSKGYIKAYSELDNTQNDMDNTQNYSLVTYTYDDDGYITELSSTYTEASSIKTRKITYTYSEL